MRRPFRLSDLKNYSLYTQLSLTLFVSITLMALSGIFIVVDEQHKINNHLIKEYTADRIRGIVSMLENSPLSARQKILENISILPVTLSTSIPWQSPSSQSDNYVDQVMKEVKDQLSTSHQIQFIDITKTDPNTVDKAIFINDKKFRAFHNKNRIVQFHQELFFQVKLVDGTVLTFHFFRPDELESLSLRFIVFSLLITIIVIVIASWGIYRLTKPIESLADTALLLGDDLNTEIADTDGPKEINVLQHAFKEMRDKLRQYIHTRTQALYAVSHDLRLPLTRIRLQAEHPDIPAHIRQSMISDINEMDTMIGQTLSFLRLGKDNEPFILADINALIDRAVERLEDMNIDVSCDGRIQSGIELQPNALLRALNNITDNAIRYGAPPIEFHLVEDEESICIAIRDHGQGIPEQYHESIFEPYMRLETSRSRETGGTGLGLSIVKRVVENHQGTIELYNHVEGGLLTNIMLPKKQNGIE